LIKCPLSADYKMPSLVLRSSAMAAENMSDFLRPYRSPSMLAVAASSSAPTVNPRDGDCCEFAAHPPILVGEPISGLHYRSLSLQPVDLLALLSEPTGLHPADEDFCFRASGGLVTRSAAGYDYRGNWTSSPGRIFTYWNAN
jgi:hypothetical protein